MITVIIAAYNCQEELNNTLSRLPSKDGVHIIVVDDGSFVPLQVPSGISLIRHPRNYGVGAAFNTGVRACTTEQIVLMGADVIPDDGWHDKAVALLDNHPMSLICTGCSGFSDNQPPFHSSRSIAYGADIIRTHRRVEGVHTITDIIQARWKRGDHSWDNNISHVGCILGAFYLTSKTLYNNVGGWMGHKCWGGLEPMISIRAKRSGYPVLVTRNIEVAHHFNRDSQRTSNWPLYFYNKLFMSETMFENPNEMRNLLLSAGGNKWVREADNMIRKEKRTGYLSSMREFHRQRWPGGLIKEGEAL